MNIQRHRLLCQRTRSVLHGQRAVAAVCCIAFLLWTALARTEELPVNSYYGHYDASQKKRGFPSASLTGPKTETWSSVRPARAYHLGILLPHLNDSYWATVNYGIVSYARKLGLRLTVYLAGAYTDLGNQRSQLQTLVTRDKTDGIILASVDYEKMDPFVAEADRAGVPVVGLINDIYAPAIEAKSMVSFHEMGYKAGEHVMRHAGNKDFTVAFFPGPRESGWASDTYHGFLAAVDGLKAAWQNVTIFPPQYGDTRHDVQQMRLDTLNKTQFHGVDYIVGNAVAADEAVSYLAGHRQIHPNAKVVATYLTATVYEQIEKGHILAAPSDQIISQCRIAVDMMVRILNGEKAGIDFPFRASALIPLITTETIGRYEYENLFGERGFLPVYSDFRSSRPAGRPRAGRLDDHEVPATKE